MIRGIVTTWKLNVAAGVTQNLLEMHGKGSHVGQNAAGLAHRLVKIAYGQRPSLFNGLEGARPHKLSVAAAALAVGVNIFYDNRDAQLVTVLSLGTVLLEITGKPYLYAFNMQDNRLLTVAEEIYHANID